MSSPAAVLDFRSVVVTPENVAFHYRAAGPFRRLPAFMIDLVIRVAVVVLVLIGATFLDFFGLGGFGVGIALVLWFLLGYFYGGLFETYWNGQTPGKRALNLRVVTVDGQPINGLQAVLRNILRDVDAMPFFFTIWYQVAPEMVQMFILASLKWFGFYWLGLIVMSCNARFQRLGDLVCGTMVIVEDRAWLRGLTRIDEPAAVRLAAYIPPSLEISRSLGQALSAYVGRRKLLAPGRRADIARHLAAPLLARFNLPTDTSHDLLLCALYYRTFLTENEAQPESSASYAPADFGPPARIP